MATKVVDVRKGSAAQVVELPANTKTFTFEYRDASGKMHSGDFTIKRLTVGDIRRMGIRKAQLNGSLPENVLDAEFQYMNTMLAHLEQAVVEAPEWWRPEDLYDAAIIVEVHKEVLAFEESFRQPVRKQQPKASADSEESADAGAAPTEEVVVQKVQSAAHA